MPNENENKVCNCGEDNLNERRCDGNCLGDENCDGQCTDVKPCELMGTEDQCEDCTGEDCNGEKLADVFAKFFGGLSKAIKEHKERPNPFPLTINSIGVAPERKVIEPGLFHRKDIGKPVAIRPCAKEYGEKTYLGVYLGEIATSFSASIAKNPEDENDKALAIGFAGHNPAIFVFELGKVIFGYESWWKIITRPEDLSEITDADINSQWYVQLFKEMISKEACQDDKDQHFADGKCTEREENTDGDTKE